MTERQKEEMSLCAAAVGTGEATVASSACTSVEPSVNAPADSPVDAPVDTPVDTPADTRADTRADAPDDTPANTPADAPAHTPADTHADTPAHTLADTPADTSADTRFDTPADTCDNPTDTLVHAATHSPASTPADPPADRAVPSDPPAELCPTLTDEQPDASPPDPHAASTAEPRATPSADSCAKPTVGLTVEPTFEPTVDTTVEATVDTTVKPTVERTAEPTVEPTAEPTDAPTLESTVVPTDKPTVERTDEPAVEPAVAPSALIAGWSLTLAAHDPQWRLLQEEKVAGWASEAVEQYWSRRTEYFDAKVNRFTRSHTPSTAKYVQFYTEWLPALDRQLFGSRLEPGSHTRRCFADLGSSPGGMSEYLVKHLGWSGYAFSLPPAAQGFAMSFAHPRLRYADCDLSAEGEWRKLLKYVRAASCNFVNAGVVLDRGQQDRSSRGMRTQSKREAAVAAAGQAEEPASMPADVQAGEEQVMPFVRILRNELLFALHALAHGGDLYFAYQVAQTALMFRLLLWLRPCFEAVRVTPTFAAGRTPVYIFMKGFLGGEAADLAIRALEQAPVGDDAFSAWHVSEWSAEVDELYSEMRGDLQAVWRHQTEHLRTLRVRAEREYRPRGGEERLGLRRGPPV